MIGCPGGATIALPVSINDLPQEVEVKGKTLHLKDSFHVSLVCAGEILKKHEVDMDNFVKKVEKDFCNFIQDNPVELTGYEDEYRFVEEGDNYTLIVMCSVSNLDKFFDLLNQTHDLNLEYPPTHVTLYSLIPNTGIFVSDSSDIDEKTKVVQNPLNTILSV